MGWCISMENMPFLSATILMATYNGEKFLAAIEDGYISATQFHPEKSGAAGLALIKNWVDSL